jgi:hypothetical protein
MKLTIEVPELTSVLLYQYVYIDDQDYQTKVHQGALDSEAIRKIKADA